jgi:hypothetical protein
MTDGAKALLGWIKSTIGIPAYAEPVSLAAELPYVSMSYQEGGDYGADTIQQLTIWTRSDASYKKAYDYADKLSLALGDQGAIIKGDECALYVRKGSPFVQNRLDDTKTIRAVLVNLIVSYYGG